MTSIFGDRANLPRIYTAHIDLVATGTVVAGIVGTSIRVFAIKLAVTAELTCYFRSGAATPLEGGMLLSEKAGYIESVDPPAYLLSTAAGEALVLVMDKGNVTGRVSYWLE